MRKGRSVPSANRIVLLRDADGDGVAEQRVPYIDGLKSPFGMAVIGSSLYVANTDGVLRLPYVAGSPRVSTAGQLVVELPGGPLNHHWTKNILASADGRKLYATVGSNSNVGENGLDKEEGRAAIWEIDLQQRSKRLFATRSGTPTAWHGSRPPARCGPWSTNATNSAVIWSPTSRRAVTQAPRTPRVYSSTVRRGLGSWYRGRAIQRSARWALLLSLSLSGVSQAVEVQTDARAAPVALSAQEAQHILALGPWPPAPRRDPGNRVSGNALAIELGRQLFRDPRMSPVGYIACVTCHQPDRAFTDIKARAHGLADLPRNTPALANLSLQRWFGWGGASDSLWMASIKPILDAREFNGNSALVTRCLRASPNWPRATGASSASRRNATRSARWSTSARRWRRTSKRWSPRARRSTNFATRWRAATRTGWRRIRAPRCAGSRCSSDGAGCVSCHSGPNFSDGQFHPGVTPADDMAAAVARSLADDGRLGDARYLKASRFNLQGAYNDDASRRNAVATRHLAVNAGLAGQFRTPTLRNVAVTAPYFHDGQAERLTEALRRPRFPAWPRCGAGRAAAGGRDRRPGGVPAHAHRCSRFASSVEPVGSDALSLTRGDLRLAARASACMRRPS